MRFWNLGSLGAKTCVRVSWEVRVVAFEEINSRQRQRLAGAKRWAARGRPFESQLPYFGWGTMRRYGLGAFQPPGNFCFASSSGTEGRMMTSSPCFQFAGVATLCLAVS